MLDSSPCSGQFRDLGMAVCRRTRVIKLTTLLILILLGLSYLFPDELQNFMAQFAPPSKQELPHKNAQHHNHDVDNEPDRSNNKESRGGGEALMPGQVVMSRGEGNRRLDLIHFCLFTLKVFYI